MKTLKFTNQWAKDLKTVKKYPSYKEDKLKTYQDMIAAGEPLPPNTKDHKLAKQSPKQYQGLRNFHLAPDICVLYDLRDDDVIFHRIGKHNHLKMTESVLKLSVNF